MATTADYNLNLIGAASGYVKPSDWDRLSNTLSTNVAQFYRQYFANSVLTGFTTSGIVLDVTVTGGTAWCGPAFIYTSSSTTITLPNTNTTYKIYMAVADPALGTFNILYTTAAVPTDCVYLADVVVSGGVITTSTDKRTIRYTVANHDHSGGTAGPQLTNTGIAAGAAIAYSKLALTGSIVNADINASAAIAYSKLNLATSIQNSDLAATTAKLAAKNNSNTVLGTDINTIKYGYGFNPTYATQQVTVAMSDVVSANSAAATTLGSVVKRIPVYDASGTLLGQIPVYNSIT